MTPSNTTSPPHQGKHETFSSYMIRTGHGQAPIRFGRHEAIPIRIDGVYQEVASHFLEDHWKQSQ